MALLPFGRTLAAHAAPTGGAWPRGPAGQPSLERCVLLALLLHILAFMLIGLRPPGPASRGELFEGPLVVRLQGSAAPRGREPIADRTRPAPTAMAAPAPAATSNEGLAVSKATTSQGPASATPSALPAQVSTAVSPTVPTLWPWPGGAVEAPAAPPVEASDGPPALLAAPSTSPVTAPAPRRADRAPTAANAAAASSSGPGVPQDAEVPLPAVVLPAPARLAVSPPPIASMAAPTFTAVPVEVAPAAPSMPAPAPPVLPEPARLREAAPAPLRVPAPEFGQAPSVRIQEVIPPVVLHPAPASEPAPVPVPAPAPVPPPAPVTATAPEPAPAPLPAPVFTPAPPVRETVPAVRLPEPVLPPTPVIATPPEAHVAPSPARETAPRETAPRESTPAASSSPSSVAPRPLPPGAHTSPLAPAVPPGSGTDSGRVNLDGSPVGRPDLPASAPAAEPSAPLNLNLPMARPGSGEGARGPGGLLPVLPVSPDQPSKLSRDLDKASREDCTKAYGDAGLLAVIPLAKDAITGKGCKW
jgi:hypothetical protein